MKRRLEIHVNTKAQITSPENAAKFLKQSYIALPRVGLSEYIAARDNERIDSCVIVTMKPDSFQNCSPNEDMRLQKEQAAYSSGQASDKVRTSEQDRTAEKSIESHATRQSSERIKSCRHTDGNSNLKSMELDYTTHSRRGWMPPPLSRQFVYKLSRN